MSYLIAAYQDSVENLLRDLERKIENKGPLSSVLKEIHTVLLNVYIPTTSIFRFPIFLRTVRKWYTDLFNTCGKLALAILKVKDRLINLRLGQKRKKSQVLVRITLIIIQNIDSKSRVTNTCSLFFSHVPLIFWICLIL